MKILTTINIIALTLVIITAVIFPVKAMELTGQLKESTQTSVAPNSKIYTLENIKITGLNQTLGKPIGMIDLIGATPTVTIGEATMALMGSIKTQASPTEMKLVDIAVSTPPQSIKKVGTEQTISGKGIGIVNHVTTIDATTEAVINGNTGTLYIRIPETTN